MGKIESTIKSEIQRLAKREIKSVFFPLRREVRSVRLKLSSLSKNFRVLDRMAKEQIIPMTSEKFKLEASPEEVKAADYRRLGFEASEKSWEYPNGSLPS